MKHVTIVVVLASLVVVATPLLGWIVPGAMADGRGFSIRDLNGPKGFSFDGIIFAEPALPIPVTAVGQFEAKNGRVKLLKRTLNAGGVLIVTQEFAGVAEVEKDGTGTARFCSTKTTLSLEEPPFDFPAVTYEEFTFVITGKDNSELEFIGTRLLGSFDGNAECNLENEDGGIFGPSVEFGVSVRGIARTQYVDDDD